MYCTQEHANTLADSNGLSEYKACQGLPGLLIILLPHIQPAVNVLCGLMIISCNCDLLLLAVCSILLQSGAWLAVIQQALMLMQSTCRQLTCVTLPCVGLNTRAAAAAM
jgi:hypothetical protein